jgi:CheY-like chemotaxis protein
MHIEIDEGIKSILIVEDEGLLATLMEDIVRSLGVEDVHVCADIESALRVATSENLDCAILDLRVRGGSSTEIADVLADRNIPFLFSTGSDRDELGDRHSSRPVITKPFADDDLKLIVLDTWTLWRSQRGATAPTHARVAPPTPTD